MCIRDRQRLNQVKAGVRQDVSVNQADKGHDQAGRRGADRIETARANRAWWDLEADDYYAEHGAFLGDDDFVWGPEGLREADAGLLGELDVPPRPVGPRRLDPIGSTTTGLVVIFVSFVHAHILPDPALT